MHLQASVFYISVVPSLVIKYSIPHQTFLLKFGFKYGFYWELAANNFNWVEDLKAVKR